MSVPVKGARNHDPAWQFNAPAFKRAMLDKAVSPYDLERLTGVYHSITYRLMIGITMNPRADMLMSLAEGLGMDPRELMVRRC